MKTIRRALLPLAVWLAVVGLHVVWLGLFPERDAAQDRWVAVPSEASWFHAYVDGQSYFLGYSYGLSAAFAAVALRRWRERGEGGARRLALGSLGVSGIFSIAGCWLLGCCGSPMLGVYLSFFGAAFLPFAKPLVAGMTTVSIGAAWWWMSRRARMAPCTDAACGCEPVPTLAITRPRLGLVPGAPRGVPKSS